MRLLPASVEPSRRSPLRTHLSHLVRRGSQSHLLTVSPGPRFGNFLYYWLHADIRQWAGERYRVQVHSHLKPWLDLLDSIRDDLSVRSEGIGIFDRREWAPQHQYQRFGSDFTEHELWRFVHRRVLSSDLLILTQPHDFSTLTVNVRRGDYYSDPVFAWHYSYNFEEYLALALRRATERASVSRIRVVSDDPVWCRENVHDLLSSTCGTVLYADDPQDAITDFRDLASSPRIIGTNSTFSYWGAYVSWARFGRASHLIMPRFMSRERVQGAEQLLPVWDVINDIPGGWQGGGA